MKGGELAGLVFLIAVIVLIINFALGNEFQKIAESKGYNDSKKYLWITFFFGIVGMLLVVALPDLYCRNCETPSTNTVEKDEN